MKTAAKNGPAEKTATYAEPLDRDAEALDAALAATIAKAEGVVRGYRSSTEDGVGRLYKAMLTAQAIDRLDALLDDKMMARIMRLQATKLGFLTDKDREQGYPVNVVKRCVIIGLLRGFYPVGNEMNIIAGNFYATLEGYTRLVSEIPNLTALVLSPGVPAQSPGGNALVPYIAEWKLEGVRQRLERLVLKREDGTAFDGRIPVVVNRGMGVDAILGKARRKMLAAIHARVTGSSHGDEDDEPVAAVVQADTAADALAARLGVLEANQTMDAPTNEQLSQQVPAREPGEEG